MVALDEVASASEPRYRLPENISQSEIRNELSNLTLFGDDPNLRIQAFNLALVDEFIMRLEYDLMKRQLQEERAPVNEATFVSAQSQMWIFAAYELMRTWRQRAREIIKLFEAGTLRARQEELRKDEGFHHVARIWRAEQIESILASPSRLQNIRDDLRRTHIPFARMEFIRISLAKHEVRRQRNSVALMPTLGRINTWCGSLDFEIENGAASLGTISRRDIADEIRAFSSQEELPSDELIQAFEEFMQAESMDIDWQSVR